MKFVKLVLFLVLILLGWNFDVLYEESLAKICDYHTNAKIKVNPKKFKMLMQQRSKAKSWQSYRYCLYGSDFGQFGNQILALMNARISALSLGTMVAVFTKKSFVSVLKNSLEVDDVMWNATGSEHFCSCFVRDTWERSFYKTFSYKKNNFYNYYSIPILATHLRTKALDAINKWDFEYTVHGRYFEGNCFFSVRHEHSAVPCAEFTRDLCNNYTLPAIQSYFNLSTNALLFSDGQSPRQDATYSQIDSNDFHVGLWMMVISPKHVGNPGSSDDFLIWLWKKHLFPNTVMYPKECFPI